jgi:hypothetical protein
LNKTYFAGNNGLIIKILTDDIPTNTSSFVSEKNSIKIYPNPAIDDLIIEVDNLSNDSFVLYSFDGKVIKKGVLLNLRTHISLKGLAEGIYFLQVNEIIKKLIISD